MARGRERRSRTGTGPFGERRTGERRSSQRISLEMWVEQTVGKELYFQHAANLSQGGIFLERTIPHPTGTVVNLRFTLPGDDKPISVRGEIVNTGTDGEELGMGVRFLELEASASERIRRFVEREKPNRR